MPSAAETAAGCRPEERPRDPAGCGDTDDAIHVGRAQLLLLCGTDTEDLVRDAVGGKEPVREREALVELLGEGKRHERIADVDGELHERHFEERTARRNDLHTCRLSGRGEVRQRDERSLQHGEPGFYR